MKIEKKFYVLVRLNSNQKDLLNIGEADYKNETVFLAANENNNFDYTDNIEKTIRFESRRSALVAKASFESEHTGFEDSGFVPVLVTMNISW